MQAVSEQKFLHIYGNLLVQCWGSPPLKKRFKESPELVLKEFGLDPNGAKVQLLAPGSSGAPASEITPQSQVVLWNKGLESGNIEFYFPEQPPEGQENIELSDADLEAVAGGWSISCCSCTPCCCC